MSENLNRGFDIPLSELEEKISTGINSDLKGYERVIPLRDISEVDHIALFNEDILYALIRKIPLRGTNIFPYEDSEIKTFNRDAEGLDIGQTYILKEKIFSIMKAFSRGRGNLFKKFV